MEQVASQIVKRTNGLQLLYYLSGVVRSNLTFVECEEQKERGTWLRLPSAPPIPLTVAGIELQPSRTTTITAPVPRIFSYRDNKRFLPAEIWCSDRCSEQPLSAPRVP
jgi:hypothetical protein